MNRLRETFPELPAEIWERLTALAALHREWNAKVNLVSRKDIENLEWHHYAPCLAGVKIFAPAGGSRLLDIGTGGGFPGLLLAMLFPNVQFDLADSIGKKVLVVADIAERLALPNVRTLNVRAETLRRDYDYVTGRAVTALPQFLKLAKQCLRTRQSDAGVLYWQGGDPAETQRETGIAPAKLLSLESALNDARFSGKYIAFYPRSALR